MTPLVGSQTSTCPCNSVVECWFPKPFVAGSNPVKGARGTDCNVSYYHGKGKPAAGTHRKVIMTKEQLQRAYKIVALANVGTAIALAVIRYLRDK